MISPVFVGPLLTFALPIFIATNADSSCDAQGQPGRSQHATDHEVREGYFLFAIRLNRKHVVFLLVEFSWSLAVRLVAEADSKNDSTVRTPDFRKRSLGVQNAEPVSVEILDCGKNVAAVDHD